MTEADNQENKTSLMNVLEHNLLLCFSRLKALLYICDQNIAYIANGRKDITTDLYVHQYYFRDLGECIDAIVEVAEKSRPGRLIEKEIRETLLSYGRDRHDEVYYVLVKNVLSSLEQCRFQAERYLSNRKHYDNYILTSFSSKGEETTEYALRITDKLVNKGSKNFINRLFELTFLIKSVIPMPDLPKVLPAEELATSTIQEPEPTEPEKGLSAPQQLLFIRLLQQSGLFPEKRKGTDDAPELRAIALLTGLDFKNDIKGGRGANAKVNKLLDPLSRPSFTTPELKQKFIDLDAVESLARLLNVELVIRSIQSIRADLEELHKS